MAAETAVGPLVRRYEGAAQGRGVAAFGWRVCLAHRFEEPWQPYGAADLSLREVLRHVGLGLRYGVGMGETGTGNTPRGGGDKGVSRG